MTTMVNPTSVKTLTKESFDKLKKHSNKQFNTIILFIPETTLTKKIQEYESILYKLSEIYKTVARFYICNMEILNTDSSLYSVANVPTIHILNKKDEVIAYVGTTKPSLEFFTSFIEESLPVST